MSDVRAAVLFAVEAFYHAFADRDLKVMADVWDAESPVSCIHPGWHPLSGREEVMDSWEAILGNPDAPEIDFVDATVHVHGHLAVVTGFERVDGSFLAASNVLIERGGRWFMIHHQAGPVASPPDEEETSWPSSGGTVN